MVIWVSQRFRDKKIGFNSCECTKFVNIANIHALDVWGKHILICNNKIFFLCFFSVYSFCNSTFSTPVTSSNLRNQATLFSELRLLQGTKLSSSWIGKFWASTFQNYFDQENWSDNTKVISIQTSRIRSRYLHCGKRRICAKSDHFSRFIRVFDVGDYSQYRHEICRKCEAGVTWHFKIALIHITFCIMFKEEFIQQGFSQPERYQPPSISPNWWWPTQSQGPKIQSCRQVFLTSAWPNKSTTTTTSIYNIYFYCMCVFTFFVFSGLQYQTILNFQPPLPLNGNLRNTSYMKQIPNYEL